MTSNPYSLDANIVFYALDLDGGEKHDVAMRLWAGMRHRSSMLTVQTLCETYWAVHRKRPQDLTQARHLLTVASQRIKIVVYQPADFLEAVSIHERRPTHFWDALLASTLRRNGCRVLLTEDIQDRGTDAGLHYMNPFLLTDKEQKHFID